MTSDVPKPAPDQRSMAIDFLRALSVLWIVGFWHVSDYVPELGGLKNTGTYLVTVFCLALFVLISGFLLGRRPFQASRANVGRFYLSRFGRVYPPFVAASALFALIGFGAPESLVKGVFLIAMLWGPPPLTLWFMAMICLLYAITPALLVLRRNNVLFWAAIIAASAIGAFATSAIDPRLILYFPVYCLGIWLSAAPERLTKLVPWIAFAIPFVFALSTSVPLAHADQNLLMLPWALTSAPLILALAIRIDVHLPRWQAIAVVSAASFFLYLFHRVAYAAALHLHDPSAPLARAFYLSLIVLPVAMIASWIGQSIYDRCWSWIEAHFHLP